MPKLADPVSSYPALALAFLPPVVQGIFYLGLLATVMSTVDGYTFIGGVNFGRDLLWRWRRDPGGPLLDKCLVTNVPLDITLEKLRGFVCDQQASITQIEGEQIDLLIQPGKSMPIRRSSDRRVPLLVELKFAQLETVADETAGKSKVLSQTRIQVVVRPKKNRDRRHTSATEQARHVLASLRAAD
jgi:hypothetical protein